MSELCIQFELRFEVKMGEQGREIQLIWNNKGKKVTLKFGPN